MRLKHLFKVATGFTLIELTLVAALLSAIGVALYASFSTGISAWQKINAGLTIEDINIFLDKISSELRNSFQFKGILLKGESGAIRFPILFYGRDKKGVQKEIGEVHYEFNQKLQGIYRTYRSYSEVYQEKNTFAERIAGPIQSFELQYYYYDPQQEEYLWTSVWQNAQDALGFEEEKKLPAAVRIIITVRQEDEARQIVKTVSIPSSGRFYKKDEQTSAR